MKFVIWGIGMRGKTVFKYLGTENVAAFLETDKNLIGSIFWNKPIIDFATYKECYKQNFLVVSPIENKAIIDFLEKEKVNDYLLPSEILI